MLLSSKRVLVIVLTSLKIEYHVSESNVTSHFHRAPSLQIFFAMLPSSDD